MNPTIYGPLHLPVTPPGAELGDGMTATIPKINAAVRGSKIPRRIAIKEKNK